MRQFALPAEIAFDGGRRDVLVVTGSDASDPALNELVRWEACAPILSSRQLLGPQGQAQRSTV